MAEDATANMDLPLLMPAQAQKHVTVNDALLRLDGQVDLVLQSLTRTTPPEVVADGPIALARLIPAGVDVRGNSTRARIVLFRKPIERRAKDTEELTDLLHEVLVAQVATYLGVEPSVIDPTLDDD